MADEEINNKQKYLELLRQSDLNCKTLIELLTNISELMRGDVSGHANDVADHAIVLATSLDFKKPNTHYIYYAALLHEIGMFCVPPNLQKNISNQKLTTSEINVLKQIPEMGYLLLMSVDILRPVANIILYHQEYLDGSGYPKGLKKEQIPLEAQILAVVVDYFKIINNRFFQDKVESFQAFNYIRERSGILYNQEVVEKFSQILSFEQPIAKYKNDDKVLSSELKSGMILAKGLFSANGVELFHKGRVLNERDINAILNIETMSGKQLEIFVMSNQVSDYSNPFVRADLDLNEISILLGDNTNIRDL